MLYFVVNNNPAEERKFEYVYQHYFSFMYHIAYATIQSSDLAEEAVHEAFVQVLKELDSLRIENERELKSYLYLITRDRSIDFIRKWERKKGHIPLDEAITIETADIEPESIAFTRIQLEHALHILSIMPDIYQRALTLRVKGYSIKEIAKITQCSESNVKSRIHRARKMLLHMF